MRADVKLGVICSAVIVLVAGGYYTWRTPGSEPIELGPAVQSESDTGNAAPGINSSRTGTTAERSSDPESKSPTTATRPQPSRTRQPGTRTRPSADPQDSANTATNPNRRLSRGPTERTSPPGSNASTENPVRNSGAASTTPATDSTSASDSSTRRLGSSDSSAQDPMTRNLNERRATGDDATIRPTDISPVGRPSNEGTADARTASNATESVNTPNRSTISDPTGTGTERTGDVSTDPATARRPLTRGELSARSNPRDSSRTPVQDGASGATAVAVEKHIVQPGDSFSSIARKYYGSERYTTFLIQSNPQIANPNLLSIGNQIMIPPRPSDDDGPVASLRTMGPGESGSAATNSASKAGRTYRVRDGDSFYGIARDVLGDAMRWKEIFELNRQAVQGDPTRLRAGQTIVLPER
jgi:nucleoid-associated protein YgaU